MFTWFKKASAWLDENSIPRRDSGGNIMFWDSFIAKGLWGPMQDYFGGTGFELI